MCSDAKKIKLSLEAGQQEYQEQSEEEDFWLEYLPNHVLLEVYSYLNWTDSVHLAWTSDRLNEANFWKHKEGEVFDLNDYVKNGKVPMKDIFGVFGQHVHVLRTSAANISEIIVEKCFNVKSLRITSSNPAQYSSQKIAWMKRLNLESIWGVNPRQLEDLFSDSSDRVTNVKEVNLGCFGQTDLVNHFLDKYINLERLRLCAHGANFHIGKLQHLQCLHIFTLRNSDLNRIMDYGKLEGLTEFHIRFVDDNDAFELETFVRRLFELPKLEKLNLESNTVLGANIFSMLELHNMKALSLCAIFAFETFIQLVEDHPAPRLKYLRLKLSSRADEKTAELIGSIINKWKNVEKICCSITGYNTFENYFFWRVLKKCTDRLPLTLEVHDRNVSKRIMFNFNSQQYQVFYQRDASVCMMKEVFGFEIASWHSN